MALQEELKAQGDFLFRNRSYLPLFFLAVGLAIYVHAELTEIEGPDAFLSEFGEYICLAISLMGLCIRIYTVGHTPDHTSGRNTGSGQLAEELNTRGTYSIVRHPLYLGNFFMWSGIALLTENPWFVIAFVLSYTFYYERIMFAEEFFLRKKFGGKYLSWASRVPAFIPSFRNYRKSNYSFSIKKVLKNEKNGFAGIFILFWLFEFVGECAEKRAISIEYDFWFYGAALSLIVYFFLKILKRKGLLNEINRKGREFNNFF